MTRLVATAAIFVALGAAPASGASSARRPDCEPADARVLLSSAEVTVYGYAPDSGDRQDILRACTGAGVDLSLSTVSGGGSYYRPPVMALSGNTVAVVTDGPEDLLEITAVQVAQDGFRYVIGRPRERVGGLRVRPDGRMAWISCPLSPEQGLVTVVSPRPNCVRAGGSRNRVYVFSPRPRRVRRIGSGCQLNPRSLRMSRRVVTWTQRGQRRRHVYRR